jgi:GNAT superfamily N-acetyltransferase
MHSRNGETRAGFRTTSIEFAALRRDLDEGARRHYGRRPIPRVGILSRSAWDAIQQSGGVLVDDAGDLLACSFRAAYPGSRVPKDAAYLLPPIWAIRSNHLDMITRAGFGSVVGEVVVPALVDGPVCELTRDAIHAVSTRARREAVAQLERLGGGFEPLGDKGLPLLHFEYACTCADLAALNTAPRDDPAAPVGDFLDGQQVAAHSGALAKHLKAVFHQHSEENTVIDLAPAGVDELEMLATDPDWMMAAHLNGSGDVDGALLGVTDYEQISAVDPLAFSVSPGAYVDALSTEPTARGLWVAQRLMTRTLGRWLSRTASATPHRFGLSFDTVGSSTEVVPLLVLLVLKRLGIVVEAMRADSIHIVWKDLS